MWWQQIRRGEDAGVWTHPLQHESATDAGAGQGRDEQENASGENLLIGLILARLSVNSMYLTRNNTVHVRSHPM